MELALLIAGARALEKKAQRQSSKPVWPPTIGERSSSAPATGTVKTILPAGVEVSSDSPKRQRPVRQLERSRSAADASREMDGSVVAQLLRKVVGS